MEQHYLAIIFCRNKEYGIVFPYDPTKTENIQLLRCMMDREVVNRIEILYNGNDKNEVKSILKTKNT